MPTYDYHCRACNQVFQAHHAIAASVPECPGCGSVPQRVVLSAPAIHGQMAQGRAAAVSTLEKPAISGHGPSCPCCR